jgi:adenylate cyclase
MVDKSPTRAALLLQAVRREPILRWLVWRVVVAGLLIGALYGGIRYGYPAMGGAVGAAMATGFFALERFVLRRNAGGLIPPLPFLTYFWLRSILYVGVFALAIFAVGGFGRIGGGDLLVSLSLAVGANLLFSVNDLLGPGVLFAFAAGRYSEPRIEERALLFIDMRSSTAIAERLGETRYLKFLNRFIADVSLGVAEGGGEIHKYVGDEIIATWRLAPGVNEAQCVGACFAALARLNAQARTYEREFGERADFRAGLHCGPVAVGELGTLKKEIALIGDAMNTAARILEACRAADTRVLASAALLDRVAAFPPGVTRRGLGELAMRGKERALELYVLESDLAGAG